MMYAINNLYLILYEAKDVDQTNSIYVGALKLANYSSPSINFALLI